MDNIDLLVLVLSKDQTRVSDLSKIIESDLGQSVVCLDGRQVLARHAPTIWVRPGYDLVVVDARFLGPEDLPSVFMADLVCTIDLVCTTTGVPVLVVIDRIEGIEASFLKYGPGGPMENSLANPPWRYVCTTADLPKALAEFESWVGELAAAVAEDVGQILVIVRQI